MGGCLEAGGDGNGRFPPDVIVAVSVGTWGGAVVSAGRVVVEGFGTLVSEQARVKRMITTQKENRFIRSTPV